MQYLKNTVSENDTDRFIPLVQLARKNGLSVTKLIEKFKDMSHVKHLSLSQLEEEEKLINYKTSSLSRKQREEVLTLLSSYRGMLDVVKKIKDEEDTEKTKEQETVEQKVVELKIVKKRNKTFATVNSTAMVKPAAIIENDVSHIQPTKEAING